VIQRDHDGSEHPHSTQVDEAGGPEVPAAKEQQRAGEDDFRREDHQWPYPIRVKRHQRYGGQTEPDKKRPKENIERAGSRITFQWPAEAQGICGSIEIAGDQPRFHHMGTNPAPVSGGGSSFSTMIAPQRDPNQPHSRPKKKID
jgi:hypothetical protein